MTENVRRSTIGESTKEDIGLVFEVERANQKLLIHLANKKVKVILQDADKLNKSKQQQQT